MKSHNWEQRIGVQNEGKKQKIIGIKSRQQQNKIYELKVKSRNLEWKLDTQKIKVGVMNAKVWIRMKEQRECMSFASSSSCMLTNLQTQSITKQM